MLTQCPNCQTIYQITAGELGAAKGFVECGDCRVQFNALDRIADEPAFDTQQTKATESDVQDEKPAPTFVLMDEGESATVERAEDSPALTETNTDEITAANLDKASQNKSDSQSDLPLTVTEEHDKTLELAVLADEPMLEKSEPETATIDSPLNEQPTSTSIDDSVQEIVSDNSPTSSRLLPPEEHDILFSEPLEDSSAEMTEAEKVYEDVKITAESNIDLDEVPSILQEELLAMQKPKNTGVNILWFGCAMLLLVCIGFQAAWHFRHPLLERFPTVAPYVEQACVMLGCELNNNQVVEPIQLVSRDVCTHPRYENALLVNASLVNSGAEIIAFPTVQLGLFDPTGTAIGIRQFSPTEYLDKSIEINAGIPPGRSVHVVFELANTGDAATSFEFSFH